MSIYNGHVKLYLCCAQPFVFHISFSCMCSIDTVQTPIKRPLLALNLPAFLPRALEMEKSHPGVTTLHVPIQRNPTAVLFSLPKSPVSVQTPFTTARLSLRSEFRHYWSCFYLFISPPHSCITVAVTVDNVAWVCYGESFSIYGTSDIPDLFAHLLRNLNPFSCPMTVRKESIIYSESKNLCRRRD